MQRKVEELSVALRDKHEDIISVQTSSLRKDEEIAALKEKISSYAAKSSAIEEQLCQLERSQKVQKPTEIIKYVESEDTVALKHRVE